MSYPVASREDAFQAWYRMGRPGSDAFVAQYRDQRTGGKKFAKRTFENWRLKYSWDARADSLDLVAAQQAEAELIEERRKTIKAHRNLGKLLQSVGSSFFIDPTTGKPRRDVINSDSTAIYAVTAGIKIEREAMGMPEIFAVISNMNDDQLVAFIQDQLKGGDQAMSEFEDAETSAQ